jgi:hypothetical protein
MNVLGLAAALALAGAEMHAEIDAKLRAISGIESGDNDRKRGEAGELGRYQIGRATWRRHMGKEPFEHAHIKERARACAYAELTRLEVTFRKTQGRWPRPPEIYAMWRLGYGGLVRRKLRIPESIKDSCERYDNLYQAYRSKQ